MNIRTLVTYMAVGGVLVVEVKKKKVPSQRGFGEVAFTGEGWMSLYYQFLDCTHLFYTLFCMYDT